MPILKVEKLSKRYEKFLLDEVSFELEKGYIMGFIGINGAGKTTTLKAILNTIKKDGGKVSVLGKEFLENELQLKKEIGYMFGGVDYYSKRKLKSVTDVVSRFYPNWDKKIYESYMKRFSLDEDKRIGELSDGMKVKYSLALALSHNARLFILDEPTSGLDPAARDDLLEIFQELIENGQRSILFSTHITSDLEKCADYITYIDNGKIIASASTDEFINSYKMIKGPLNKLTDELKGRFISVKINSFGFSGLIKTQNMTKEIEKDAEPVNMEEIMIYHSKKEVAK